MREDQQAVAVRRRYVLVNGRHVHYRVAGDGPALLLLHDAPGSSQSLVPLAARLGGERRVYAPDAPGHGLSDALDNAAGLASYVEATLATADALGLTRFDVAGTGAGGVLAEAVAAAAPARIGHLVADALPPGTLPERQRELAAAFPAFAPRSDGGHLVALWHMVRRTYLYDPWYATDAGARRIGDVPDPRVLHGQAMDVLRAGDGYADLARAAASPHMPHTAAADALAARIPSATAGLLPPSPALPPQPSPGAASVTRGYLDTPFGQLHARLCGAGGTPLVVVHPSPGSAAALEPLVQAFGRSRLVIAPDTLGNGDSDRPDRDETDIALYAEVLAAALDALDLPEVDVWGSHTGALIGMELAIRRPERVRALGLDGITLFGAEEVEDLLAHYLPPLEPDPHGLHLLKAWHMRQDMSLFWPWYRHTAAAANRVALPAADRLHRWVLDLLVSGPTWRTAYRAAFAYPTRERLPLLRTPTLLATGPDDLLRVFTEEAAALNPHLRVASSAGTRDAQAQQATAAVYETFFNAQAAGR